MTGAWVALAVAVAGQGLALELMAPGRPWSTRALRTLPALALALIVVWAVTLSSSGSAGPRWIAWVAAAWWMIAIPAFVLAGLGRPPGAVRAAVPIAVAQAAPGAILSFAPALAWHPWTFVVAGSLKAMLPPVHAPATRAAEALSPGSFGLVLAGGLLLGGPLAVLGALALDPFEALVLAQLLGVAIAISGLASASDDHLFRRLGAWASVQAGLAVLMAALGASGAVGAEHPAALSHLASSVAALVAMTFVLGRVASFVHVGDLAAYSGVLRAAILRGQSVLAVSFLAIVASAQAPYALVRVALFASGAARLASLLGLAGWFGVSLAIVLAATRVARGRASAPAGPAPEMRRIEIACTVLLFLLVVVAFLLPALWQAPAAWTRLAPAAQS